MDELSNAPPAVQNIAYKITLDRMVGNFHLHENAFVIAAGNLETDGANVETMSSALISRMAVFEAYADPREWCELAAEKGIDHRIISFINWKPDYLHTFNPDSADVCYACPRTWFKTSPLTKDQELPPHAVRLLAPLISEGVAREFVAFTEIYTKIPSIEAITANPKGTEVPSKLDLRWAVLGAVTQHMTEQNVEHLMEYLLRFPAELVVVAVRQLLKRFPHLKDAPVLTDWIDENVDLLIGV